MKMKQGIDFCHLEPLTHIKKMKMMENHLKKGKTLFIVF